MPLQYFQARIGLRSYDGIPQVDTQNRDVFFGFAVSMRRGMGREAVTYDQLAAGMQYDPTKLLESGAIVCGVHIVCSRRT
jgi:hypothetical protein